MAMTEFRPCPNHPGFEVTFCGIVRRLETFKLSKLGNVVPLPSKVLSRVGRRGEYVTIKGEWIKALALVEDAWGIVDEDRPASSYPDGRVITLAEFYRIMRASRCRV